MQLMSDRAVQDEIIRYLADATARTQSQFAAHIPANESPKAARFAHFLARRYYRDRLARSFRYSHHLRPQTRRTAEQLVNTPDFDGFLHECVMGSLASAQTVGRMAVAHLSVVPPPGPWWRDLLGYEYAYFLQAATSERGPVLDRPSVAVSTVCQRFAWALPKMLPRLRSDNRIGDELRSGVTLLFSRTATGRVYVVELESAMEGIFRAVDGERTIEGIAKLADINLMQAQQALRSLAEIGAVSFSDAYATQQP